MMRFWYSLLWYWVTAISTTYAQSSFRPTLYSPARTADLYRKIQEQYQKEVTQLPKEYRNELEEIYKARYDTLTSHIRQEHYIFEPGINKYFDYLLVEVIRSNPQLSTQPVQLLISRDTEPNASCEGYGIITINTGLIRHFANESQLAFVVCHELAHHYLDHINQATRQYVEKLHSKSTRKELNRIAGSDTRRVEQATEILRNIVYNRTHHSRMYEASADSLAFIFLRNSKYDESQGLSVLALLDTIDKEKQHHPLQLQQTFDSPQFPFNESWLKSSSLMRIEGNREGDWSKDSLKTHPDCSKRIELLKRYINLETPQGKNQFLQTEKTFAAIVNQSEFESVESEFAFRKYGKCLFKSLQLTGKYPDAPYLHAVIGKCLYQIYLAQKNHELGKYVAMPAPGDSPEYRQLLDFIHNLRLRDLASLGYSYLKKHQTANSQDEDFLYALAQLSKATDNGEEA